MGEMPINTGGKSPEDYAEEQKHNLEKRDKNIAEEEKLKKLDAYFDQKIQAHLTVLTANLQEHASKIDMILQAIQNSQQQQPQQEQQQQQTQQQPQQQGDMPKLSDLPPQVQGELLTGIAQIIQAWKGTGADAVKEDYFSTMSKQITMNMLQAGVDGIMKNVYDTYNPRPPVNSIQRPQSTENRFQ